MKSIMQATFKVGTWFLFFLAGYSFCRYVNDDVRYDIERRNGEAYLYDNVVEKVLPIDERNFQVGNLEYRLEGVLRDRRLPGVLEKLSGGKYGR